MNLSDTSTGKIAAQCSHATLACYKALSALATTNKPAHNLLRRWERYGQAKVAVQVKSEEELLMLQATAMSLGVCARAIHDAGRTQIAAGSMTVLGVGPAPKGMVDRVTGRLKLL
jgi:PTH2 family peptidyl-tRNA hydrolase